MVLISTMTAFALPKLSNSLFTDQLRSTARKFIGLVAETGQTARSGRKTVRLRYDFAAREFTTASLSGLIEKPQTGSFSRLKVPDDVEVIDIISSHGGKKTTDDQTIVFSPQGYVDKTVVHLRDTDGNELSIIISPFLGVTREIKGHVDLEDDRFMVKL